MAGFRQKSDVRVTGYICKRIVCGIAFGRSDKIEILYDITVQKHISILVNNSSLGVGNNQTGVECFKEMWFQDRISAAYADDHVIVQTCFITIGTEDGISSFSENCFIRIHILFIHQFINADNFICKSNGASIRYVAGGIFRDFHLQIGEHPQSNLFPYSSTYE